MTCPHCGHVATETMPTDACIWFYDCLGYGEKLKPQPRDCCVFCSCGDLPCPSIQVDGKGCCGQASAASLHSGVRRDRPCHARPAVTGLRGYIAVLCADRRRFLQAGYARIKVSTTFNAAPRRRRDRPVATGRRRPARRPPPARPCR
ncbi:GDCCVxC domain-containing (seleno)protein [Brevundimonas sp. UBA7534]|uniref:GDCCVxC domain-containing (seleno)protein n=1 Tax=Brevundimonas sp. UBA7534 TaxID=1946138 RepID=UPI0025C6CA87|nr:GDCCVxC domain-containing (seleno)protein [Brevundimonas sp. UBA7534]